MPFDSVTGVQGGSNSANYEVRLRVEGALQILIQRHQIPAGEKATLMIEFDEKKKWFNYMDSSSSITLRGSTDNYPNILLDCLTLRTAFQSAFDDGLKLLKAELDRLVSCGRDCAVLFCGGSYCNVGLHQEVDDMMNVYKATAAYNGVNMSYTFLRDEVWWYVIFGLF